MKGSTGPPVGRVAQPSPVDGKFIQSISRRRPATLNQRACPLNQSLGSDN